MKNDIKPAPIWSCKIGTMENCIIPKGSDLLMRKAVEQAFKKITGLDCEFNFTGFSAELTESELAVVEDREPNIDVQIDELHKHGDIVQSGIAYHSGK